LVAIAILWSIIATVNGSITALAVDRLSHVDPGDPRKPFIPAKLPDNPHLDQADKKEGRISYVPFDPLLPVFTYWDLGTAKCTAARERTMDTREEASLQHFRHDNASITNGAQAINERHSIALNNGAIEP
jgi:hypothetical protein